MNKFFLHIISIIFIINCTSCSDFLEEKSEDRFTTATLFDTPEGLEKMAISLYSYERDLAVAGDWNGYLGAHIFNERLTDLVMFASGGDGALSRYTSPGPDGPCRGNIYSPFWKRRYFMIGRANEMIYYGKELGEQAKVSLAEAYFWRAYCYYGLWSRFSRVFLSTEPISKDNLNEIKYSVASKEDVFKLMYDDTEKAIKDLPINPEMEGRISQDAARHLRALIAAWDKNWTEVKKQVEEIEKNNVHELVSSPENIYNQKNLYNLSETLLALHYSKERGGATHRIGSQYVNTISKSDYTHQKIGDKYVRYNEENLGNNWGIAFPNSYLMSLYPKNDKRLQAYFKIHYTYQNPDKLITIPASEDILDDNTGRTYKTTMNNTGSPKQVKVGDIIYGRDIYAATGSKLDRRYILPSSIKMHDRWDKPLDDAGHGTRDIIVFRLAETFLLGAEACMHLNDQTNARRYYNMIWTRAGNTAITDTDITFDMIRDENARELCFEGRRWDFLKRNGIWYNQMRNYAGDFTKYPSDRIPYDKSSYGVNDGRDPKFGPNPDYYIDFNGSDNDVLVRFNVLPTHVNWPIPQDQIDAMGPDNFPQNDGY